MVELRFTAEKLNGQTLSGSLTAVSSIEGKKKTTFLYRARKGKDKPFRGEQKAFTKKEVEDALSRLGYEVLNVNKKLIDFQAKPPTTEIVTFVKISAELLDQKLSYGEI